jgi:chemotaxis protein histidine kinase CheA
MLNLQSDAGLTALMKASIGGNAAVVELLLDSAARTDVLDGFGMPALYRALVAGHHTVVALLLAHGAALQPSEPTAGSVRVKLLVNALRNAEQTGHHEAARLVRDAQAAHVETLFRGDRRVRIRHGTPYVEPAFRFLYGQCGTATRYDAQSGDVVLQLDEARFTKGPLGVSALELVAFAEECPAGDAAVGCGAKGSKGGKGGSGGDGGGAAILEGERGGKGAAEAATEAAARRADQGAADLLAEEEATKRTALFLALAARRRSKAVAAAAAVECVRGGGAVSIAANKAAVEAVGAEAEAADEAATEGAAAEEAVAESKDARAAASAVDEERSREAFRRYREQETARQEAEHAARQSAAAAAKELAAAASAASAASASVRAWQCDPDASMPSAPSAHRPPAAVAMNERPNVGAIVRFAAATAEANASAHARAAAQRAGLRPTTSLSLGVDTRPRRLVSIGCNTDATDEASAGTATVAAREAQAEITRLRGELLHAKMDVEASQQMALAFSLVTSSPALPCAGGGGGNGGGGGGGGGGGSGRPLSPTTSLVRSLTHEEAQAVLGEIAHLTKALNQLVVSSAASVVEQTRGTARCP